MNLGQANIALAAFAILIALGYDSRAFGETARSVIPIRRVVLSSGNILFSIPIKVDDTEIEAGLDTGSPGLRVLPGTLPMHVPTSLSKAPDASFQSGVKYQGTIANMSLTVGTVAGTVPLETVEHVTCIARLPNCPATQMSANDYGIRGNSLTGGRFRAIFGTNSAQSAIPNPLAALGIKRWIVQLPREGEVGKLILNPDENDLRNFVLIHNVPELEKRGAFRDAIPSCLGNTNFELCSAWLLDSGMPSLIIAGPDNRQLPWRDVSEARVRFYENAELKMEGEIALERADRGTRVLMDTGTLPFSAIISSSAFLVFDVLYEPDEHRLGLRKRDAIAEHQ